MIHKTIVLFLTFVLCSVAVYAGDGYKATHSGSSVQITPSAPGVVYVKLKVGSKVFGTTGSKGEITQSITPSSPFAKVISTLVLQNVQTFDPAPVKDSIDRALGIDRMYCLYYSNLAIDPHKALAMLVATGEVACGSPRYLFPLSFTPNDPLLNEEYALSNMNVFRAWDKTTGDTSVVIADVDNAINIDHEDLKNEIKFNWGEIGTDSKSRDKRTNGADDDGDGYIDNWQGWDVCGNVFAAGGATFKPNNNPRPRVDTATHGTHTAGCIVATGNNGLGVAGVAYGCRLLPIKAAGSDVNNISGSYEGIHYASNHGARITNCSWGNFITSADTAFANVFLHEATARNNLIVAAAGNFYVTNDPSDTNNFMYEYPANGPGVLSVGATDQNDNPVAFSDHGHTVKVWAPGVLILSCDYPGNSAYSAEDGTSFSSPLTAGAAGIIASLHPLWLPQYISQVLIQTVDNVVKPSDRFNYWGRVDLDSAVNASLGPLLIVSKYSIDGVQSDSLGSPGVQQTIKVTFQNIGGPGTNLHATILPTFGDSVNSATASLGDVDSSAFVSGDFEISRSGVYSQGELPVRFFVTNGSTYSDTISISIPLSIIPGFIPEVAGVNGSSIDRVSNTAAWAAFGQAATNTSGGTTILNAQFAVETDGSWSDTLTLNDGLNPPYCVTALDSNTAFFGSGPPGGTASVIYTTDGGNNFNEFDVSSFAKFVNTIHFFDPMNGILIGDPISSKWGIGVTTDGGVSWNLAPKALAAPGTIASWNNSASWVGDDGWFGTNSRAIYRTTNRGQTWQKTQTGTHQNSLGVAFADDAKHGFATFLPANGTGDTAVMTSADSGISWQQLTTLPVQGMLSGSVQFIPNSSTAILTSDKGVYRTSDYGKSWIPIGIPVSYNANQAAISIWRGNGEFVVSINSGINGIATYAEPMHDTVLQGVPEQTTTSLSVSVFPDPVQGNAQIEFSLMNRERVHAELFDPLGRSVRSVFDGTFDGGKHTRPLDVSGIQPGTYYLDLEVGSGVRHASLVTILP